MSKTIYDIELPEKAKEEMMDLLASFKEAALKELNKSLSDLYTDIGLHLETDSWINYRQQLQTAMENSGDWMKESHFGRKVRASIFNEHRDELIGLLNQDLLKELEDLKAFNERMDKYRKGDF